MKLSEAIRLGSMQLPQCKDELFVYDWDEKPAMACALGAAYYAVGRLGMTALEAIDIWPILDEFVVNPSTGSKVRMDRAIPTLNDCSNWTREQIADWVEAIEREKEHVDQITQLQLSSV